MMWQIAAFKYIFNWYLHPGIYSSMEYSITWRHKLCRAFTLDALASRPFACSISLTLLLETGNSVHVWVTLVAVILKTWVPSTSITPLEVALLARWDHTMFLFQWATQKMGEYWFWQKIRIYYKGMKYKYDIFIMLIQWMVVHETIIYVLVQIRKKLLGET